MNPDFKKRLLDRATRPYRAGGRFAWHFARGKLDGDPAFAALLARALIGEDDRVLDLGCGQALLANWLDAACALHAAGDWPSALPIPPRIANYRGIELMPRDVERARNAMPAHARIEQGDIRAVDYGTVDRIVILDVLHYIDPVAQDAVLARVRDALAPHGALLLRVGDAEGGLRFRISNWVDQAVTLVRGHRLGALHCRPLSAWIDALEALGFAVDALPMSAGTPFANVLLVARLGTPPDTPIC